ncbi:MAG: transposase [Actinomycetes bacterium]|nr:MAG: transposase [Actinomycetes bacterium]
MVSPSRRREAVLVLRDRLGLSERRACEIVGQHRSTQRYAPRLAGDDAALRRELRRIGAKHKRWGYRRAHAHLTGEGGWRVNRKRVQRLWREEGLRVAAKPTRRRRAGISTAELPDRATHPGHVWALDFQHDATEQGIELRFLNVIDEFTREALAVEAARSFTADRTVEVLERLSARHGQPAFVRMDNGPELTALALLAWSERAEVETTYIEPGCPWQNPWIESFNARFRDEVLDTEVFDSVLEAQVIASGWRETYNRYHPHSALGMLAPAVFAERWRAEHEGVIVS